MGNKAEAASPAVLNPNADIGTTEVVLDGYINPNGYLTTAWFEYGKLSNLLNPNETTHLNIGAGTYATHFSASIAGLKPDTTYYFRTVANNGQRNVVGDTLYFTTDVHLPIGLNTGPNILPTSVPKTTGLESSAVLGASFLPSTLTGWFILLLVILCTIFMARKLRKDTDFTEVPRKPL